MKKIITSIFVLLYAITVWGQSTTTLTFTGQDQDGKWVQLKNVTVENLSRQWQVPLAYPDTTLILNNLVGINETPSSVSNGPIEITAQPNPFDGTTGIIISVAESGTLTIDISDMNGRAVLPQNTTTVQAGAHKFSLTLNTPQAYLLTAKQNGNSAVAKIVNSGRGGADKLTYTGIIVNAPVKHPALFSPNPFAPGDYMRYTGIAERNGNPYSDIIAQYQNGNENFVFNFNLPPVILCHDTLIKETGAMCNGSTYLWRGKTLTTVGTYYDSLKTTIGGCDSVYCLTLSYLPNSTSVENVTICPGSTYIWHNKTISTAGLHLDTIPAANGCDSICRLLVNIGVTYFFQKQDSIATGNTLLWHGQTLSVSGTYYDSLKTVEGCDSVYALELSVITPLTFTCGLSVATDTDGNIYNTIQLGTQCWMKENLKTSSFPNGNTIPTSASSSTVSPQLHYPDKDIQNVAAYGYLYNWTAAMNYASAGDYAVQGVCPAGWHLPSINEWKTLINYIKSQGAWLCNGQSSYTAQAAASQIGWSAATQTCAPGYDINQNNASGFSAMPAGLASGSYTTYFGTDSKMWSSDSPDPATASSAYMQNTGTAFNTVSGIWSKGYSFSVRCLHGQGGQINVTTSAISSVGATSATGGGVVNLDGNDPIIARGICWSTSSKPTIADSHTTDGTGLGSFTSSMTGLTPLTPYHVRAYATNSFGTAYGEEVVFVIPSPNDGTTCSGTPTVTDYDGNTYNTIQLGSQCWMKENLRTTSYSDGRGIAFGNANTSASTAYFYYPYGSTSDLLTYGLLYNVAAVFDGAGSSTANPSGVQGICPTGWHLPSRAEWTQLTDYVSANLSYQCNGSYTNYAKAMCSTSNWYTTTLACMPGASQANNNATGFSITPAGYFDGSNYATAGQHANFWTSYKSGSNAYYVQFSYFYTNSYQWSDANYEAKSVRCVKD